MYGSSRHGMSAANWAHVQKKRREAQELKARRQAETPQGRATLEQRQHADAQRAEDARQKWWRDLEVKNAMQKDPAAAAPMTPNAAAVNESFVDANRKAREARLAMSNVGMSRASANILAGLKLSTPARGPTKPAA